MAQRNVTVKFVVSVGGFVRSMGKLTAAMSAWVEECDPGGRKRRGRALALRRSRGNQPRRLQHGRQHK